MRGVNYHENELMRLGLLYLLQEVRGRSRQACIARIDDPKARRRPSAGTMLVNVCS